MKEAKAGSKKGTSNKSPVTSAKTENASSEPKPPNQPAVAASAPKAPTVDRQPELPASHGKVGIFGGPKDRGLKPDDKLALPTGPHGVYERVRTLNPKSFYCAMRWNYHVEHLSPEEVKRYWANKKLLLTNAKNGNAVVVGAMDYGPHEKTGLDISISPGAAEVLGVEVGDEVEIALADPRAPLGEVE